MPELILIFIVALLVFGPKKLPEIGRSIGRGLSEFRKASDELKKTIESEIEEGKSEVASVKQQLTAVPDTLAQSTPASPPAKAAEAEPEARPIHPA